MARAPLGVIVSDTAGPGSSKGLGAWPEFPGRTYNGDGPIGKLAGIRKATLPHLQRYENQNLEAQKAKATGRPADLLDHPARFRNLQDTIKMHDTALGQLNELERQVDDMVGGLKPFDAPATLQESAMLQETRALLRAADPKTRAQMLEQFEFRQAALSPGATPFHSGLSPEQFGRYKEARLRERHPDTMQMRDDFAEAKGIVSNHLAAVRAQIDTERKSLGIPATETKATPVEAWD
jgi:hypothetical protein